MKKLWRDVYMFYLGQDFRQDAAARRANDAVMALRRCLAS